MTQIDSLLGATCSSTLCSLSKSLFPEKSPLLTEGRGRLEGHRLRLSEHRATSTASPGVTGRHWKTRLSDSRLHGGQRDSSRGFVESPEV